MDGPDLEHFFSPSNWHVARRGPRYAQLSRYMAAAIREGRLAGNVQLPPERDLARLADVSRVTVRKAIAELVAQELVDQRQGSGSYVRNPPARALVADPGVLTSFSDYMRALGYRPRTVILSSGISLPRPDEVFALGLSSSQKVARLERLRFADDKPVVIEQNCLPAEFLPDPSQSGESLHEWLSANGHAPARAMRRIGAAALSAREAERLGVAEGTAVLRAEFTSFLESGRAVEFTRGLYLSDVFEFFMELRT